MLSSTRKLPSNCIPPEDLNTNTGRADSRAVRALHSGGIRTWNRVRALNLSADVFISTRSTTELRKILVVTGLVWGLYGVLTVLAVLSVCAFTRRRASRTRPTSIVLCLTILALFASTTIFSVTYTLFNQSLLLTDYIKSGRALWTTNHGASIEYPTEPLKLVRDYSGLTDCGCTAALTVNITLGDAIVCWRACTIWHNNRLVKTVCAVLVFATFILGAVSTAKGCRPVFGAEHLASADASFDAQFGAVYQGVPSAAAASVLSLGTNLWATLLVGYKAWTSRKRLRGYLLAGSPTAKLFALLVESGAVYCAIWALMVAYETIQYRRWALGARLSAAESGFTETVTVAFGPSLVALVAIYPMIIIVLVAFGRSHMEKGLLPEHLQSLPTPDIAISVADSAATVTVTRESGPRRSRSQRSEEVLGIGIDHPDEGSLGCARSSRESDSVEDSDAGTSPCIPCASKLSEWKAGPMV